MAAAVPVPAAMAVPAAVPAVHSAGVGAAAVAVSPVVSPVVPAASAVGAVVAVAGGRRLPVPVPVPAARRGRRRGLLLGQRLPLLLLLGRGGPRMTQRGAVVVVIQVVGHRRHLINHDPQNRRCLSHKRSGNTRQRQVR